MVGGVVQQNHVAKEIVLLRFFAHRRKQKGLLLRLETFFRLFWTVFYLHSSKLLTDFVSESLLDASQQKEGEEHILKKRKEKGNKSRHRGRFWKKIGSKKGVRPTVVRVSLCVFCSLFLFRVVFCFSG